MTLTVDAAADTTKDDVAHCGPDRKPSSQSHHFAWAQRAFVAFLHRIHGTAGTQQDTPPKHNKTSEWQD